MSKRINYPEYVDPNMPCGRQDKKAITSSLDESPQTGNGMDSGTSYEGRGGGGSSPSLRTKKFTATYAPPHLTHTMCQGLGIKPHHSVLEPSAGAGGMVKVIQEYTKHITAIELNPKHQRALQLLTQRTYKRDFLRLTPYSENVSARGIACRMGLFDRIIMCPPKNSVAHIAHAIQFLKPDGALLALVQDQNIRDIGDRPWKVVGVPEKFEYNGEPIDVSYVMYAARD